MDHRISKDMISSGMIPSGEKNQEDLGKTQYGTVPSPNALSDVYKKMYETKEEVINEHHKKDADGNTIPHEDEEIKEGKMPAGLQAYLDKKKGKKEDKKEVKEEIDTYDMVLDHFLNEGYEREDILKVMSTVNLTEEPITATLAAIGTGLMKGAAVAAKGAMGAVKAGGTALKSGMKGVVSAAKGGVSSVKSGMKGVTNAAKNVTKPKVTSSGGNVVQGSSDTGGNKIKDFAKREAGNMVRQQLMKDREVSSTNKTAMATAAKTDVAASADLFDIVKGQLLDEGLSEEEIRDIMLTLTPDEILSEYKDVPAGQMNYAGFGAPKPKSYEMDSLKRQTAPGGGKDYKIEDKKNVVAYNQKKISKEEYKGSGTPEQQAAMKAQVEVSKKVNRYGGKTPSGTTAVDAKKGIEDVRKSM